MSLNSVQLAAVELEWLSSDADDTHSAGAPHAQARQSAAQVASGWLRTGPLGRRAPTRSGAGADGSAEIRRSVGSSARTAEERQHAHIDSSDVRSPHKSARNRLTVSLLLGVKALACVPHIAISCLSHWLPWIRGSGDSEG